MSQVFVLTRGRRHGALRALVPGAAYVALGDGEAALSPWDTPSTAATESKIDFLVRLHALALGGLADRERHHLAVAIRDVYARAADGEGPAGETFLRAVLADLARQELRDPRGSEHAAELLRGLSRRVAALCADGPHGDLLDRATSREIAGAPLVVLDVELVPQALTSAVLLAISERAGGAELLVDARSVGGVEESLPRAFPDDGLLDSLHEAYLRRRMRAGEARPAAYLHAISDVAHFLHPRTRLSDRGPPPAA